MQLKIFCLIAAAAVLLAACGANADEPSNSVTDIQAAALIQAEGTGFIGYVVKADGERILVVSPDRKDYSAQGGQINYYAADWFRGAPSDIEVGMKVEAWTLGGELAESYPAQGTLERISVLNDSQPKGAELTEDEAVNRALAALETDESHFTVVKSAAYDSAASEWTVYVLNEDRDHVIPIKVSER
ncbi:hypothetical protein BK133_27235 [Paenibacillus sp. FSL H8-0548]|uniref:DUF3221 domain-containing protein n=1 Tax=Paenibacillus sp. FSL H8-0548 TaxID=1920422 RepID=UPI00096EC3EA|nr:DUF3221 domain-containing protein [Paenibacillus sp. FSL H8-0548]OMF22055.1 hypothetical protein BK133_27235 [Paenibacillus sp. FSL H8-0548]